MTSEKIDVQKRDAMLALKNTAGTLPDFGLNEEVPT